MTEASSSRAVAAIDVENEEPNEKLEMQLWQACIQAGVEAEDSDQLWFQSDLHNLEVMKGHNIKILLECINKLVSQCLFRAMESRDHRACWKAVALVVASNMMKMTDTERLVYIELENAGTEGGWTKSITARSNVQSAEVLGALKKLESKGLVRPFKSAKNSNKKVYILSHLQPSEDATGGLFYSDGVLDTALLTILMQWTEVYVHRKSWQLPEKAAATTTTTTTESGKRKRQDYIDPTDPNILFGSKRHKGVKPWPAGYQDYAREGDVAKYLNKSGLLFKDKILEIEAKKVLQLLCYDGRIEEIAEEAGYRSLLRPLSNPWANDMDVARNGLGEVPCGGCPASGLCDESGPVNARTCTYFDKWLG